ncbi:hypothetical protein Ciccas_012029 [Cichlidogyrus casuarinus]|uniref:Uncharacterized protein n=1 Tax=Cichlidogyrus casuarinus TaxID=1844966 RepID=A0ABD2PRB0_9PLAT
MELDMTVKLARREQILQEKINTAKRLGNDKPGLNLSLDPVDLKRTIDEDISTKENNRRSYILGIKEHCKNEICKVETVRERRKMGELNNSSIV